MGNSSFNKPEPVEKARTLQGADTGPSPNQADGKMGSSVKGANPVGGGALANGADKPSFNTGKLARSGMGSGAEMPLMARGTPPMARIGSGDLRRGQGPMEADTARPSGSSGPKTMASFARSGGYVPLDPKAVAGKPGAPAEKNAGKAPWGSAASGAGAAPGSA